MVETKTNANGSQAQDETLDPGSEDIFGGQNQSVYPLDGGAGATGNVSTTIDPSTQGLQNSSTLAAGSINPGNNGAGGGGGINQAAMMQGMMGLMTSMLSGQQPNPAALMGMFGSAIPGGQAAGGLVTQLTPLLTQAVAQ